MNSGYVANPDSLSVPLCGCGKRFASVVGPDGKTQLCVVCAKRLARSITRVAKEARRARKRSQTMTIPRKARGNR